MYLMRPTGNPQVICHPQHLNLILKDPLLWVNRIRRSHYLQVFPWVYLQVTFVDPHTCPALEGTSSASIDVSGFFFAVFFSSLDSSQHLLQHLGEHQTF